MCMTFQEARDDLQDYLREKGLLGSGVHVMKSIDGDRMVCDLFYESEQYDSSFLMGTEKDTQNMNEMRNRVILFHCKLKRGVHRYRTQESDAGKELLLMEAKAEAAQEISKRHAVA